MLTVNTNPMSLKVIFSDDKFICHDLAVPGRVAVPAVAIVDNFVKTLNKRSKSYCVKYPSYLYIFIFLYIGTFIGLNVAGLGKYMYAAVIFLFIFIAGTIYYTCSRANFIKMIQDTCEEFRVQLSPYYTIMNKLYWARRRVGYGDSGIFMYPIVNGQPITPQHNSMMSNRPRSRYLQDSPAPLPNLVGNSPHQVPPYSRNPFQQISNQQNMPNPPLLRAYQQNNISNNTIRS